MNIIEKVVNQLLSFFKEIKTCSVNVFTMNDIIQLKEDKSFSIYQKNIFDVTKNGDLIYALMPDNEVREKLELSHQKRPYLVIDKKDNKLLAYSLSSSRYFTCSGLETYKLTKYNNDELKNDSYINLKEKVELPINHILSYIGETELTDLDEIQRRIYFINKETSSVTTLVYKPTIGDIVPYNKALWLIYDIGEKKYGCVLVKQSTSNKRANVTNIKSNSNEYLVYYKKNAFYFKDKEYEVVDIVDKKYINKVIKRLSPLKDSKDFVNMKYCLFEYGYNLYYCYKIIDDYLLCYNIYKSRRKKHYKRIVINKEQYYIDKTSAKRLKKSPQYKVIGRRSNNYEFY